jgi:hypothetical protein
MTPITGRGKAWMSFCLCSWGIKKIASLAAYPEDNCCTIDIILFAQVCAKPHGLSDSP